MDQTRDFEELDWAEDPGAVGFASDVAVDGGDDELEFEIGTGVILIYLLYIY